MRASDSLLKQQMLNPRALPSVVSINRAVENILKRWPDVVAVPEDRDRERMALDILRRVLSWDWEGLKTSRITTAAVAVFDQERCARPDLAPARQFFLNEIAARPSGSFLNAMVWIYIDSFRHGAEHTKTLAKALALRMDDFGGRTKDLLINLPGLLNMDRAPSEVAQIMLDTKDPYEALKSIGWRAPHGPGLAQHAHSVFIEKIQPKLTHRDARDQLFKWLVPKSGSPLETGAGPAIEALLSVWQHETPPDDVRHELSEAIVNAYNDPRLHRGGIWSGFDPHLRAVLLRWLTKQDMKFFCDMVTATQDSHMWPLRRDFWLDLYEDKMIDEAWVAFGGSARQFARRQLMQTGSGNLSRRFGRQLDRGGSTSLLIMRIGSKIVVDGCHSYRTHIFRQDDPKAPKLYQTQYYCDEIMNNAQKSKPHNSIPSWKSWVMQNV